MKNIKNIVIAVLVIIALVFAILYYTKPQVLGGIAHYQKESFLQGLNVGTGQQFSVSNAGVLTSSGANTLSGALTQSGASVFSGTVQIAQSASSTLLIGGTGGCIAMAMPATTTLVYLTTTSTANVIISSTTKPAGCR